MWWKRTAFKFKSPKENYKTGVKANTDPLSLQRMSLNLNPHWSITTMFGVIQYTRLLSNQVFSSPKFRMTHCKKTRWWKSGPFILLFFLYIFLASNANAILTRIPHHSFLLYYLNIDIINKMSYLSVWNDSYSSLTTPLSTLFVAKWTINSSEIKFILIEFRAIEDSIMIS